MASDVGAGRGIRPGSGRAAPAALLEPPGLPSRPAAW